MKKYVKPLFFILLIGVAGIAVWYDETHTALPKLQPAEAVQNSTKKLAPLINFTTEKGETHMGFSGLPEEIMLLNFWASWCTPCVVEIPDMLELSAKSKGKIGLVFMSIDNQKEDMQKFIKMVQRKHARWANKASVYWVWDEGGQISREEFQVFKIPETIMLDKNRRMVHKFVGAVKWLEIDLATPPYK